MNIDSNATEKGLKPFMADVRQPVGVIIADTQSLYRVGIRKIIALENDIKVLAQAESLGNTLAAAAHYKADVILFEAAITPNPPEAVSEILKRSPQSKLIIIMSQADQDDTVDLMRRGVRGIVPRSVSPELLVKCIRKVQEGELWLDNQAINWVIDAYRAQAAHLTNRPARAKLSDKELLIISYVTQGMRNKEIAHEIHTSEQVIKNYLRKIYDKLGVSDRLELALYCIHHQLLKKNAETLMNYVSQQQQKADALGAAAK
jgi:DNA-binding NarL/FixJ family response regulator